ncbi:hypothetical protein AC629_27765 [Bradyrhizobium sp. NAS80.1]|uniref:hypothetical protein n=1 Tax=Bradyrhizobium sp. NAS80.1 TaxID=1680159 RepID=UPI00095FCEF0|nr:hypothetical protein [Bradyrhizobium sp. NAS80.1]OKO80227.1 hypothetical protein AC629_27765 [Bradyrhizobium sp. NAS80.1]
MTRFVESASRFKQDEAWMIYTPSAYDARLLAYSRELVRDAFKMLRDSEHIARAQRARDVLARGEPAYGESDPA